VISLPEALTPDINLVCVYLSALEKYGLFYDACSPAKSGRKPAVLLQHGLIDSSATWVMNMPDQSLGFVLADLGYDVWLGNNRGTSYSMEHIKMDGEWEGWSEDFWDFSWDHMARYDLPAELTEILQVTGQDQVAYVGHSQGTTQAFAAFSSPELEEFADRVSIHVALAPVAFVGNTESMLFQMAGQLDVLQDLIGIPSVKSLANSLLGAGGGANMIQSLVPGLCSAFLGGCENDDDDNPHEFFFNTGMMGSLFGLPDMKHLNQTRIPVYLAHIPEGTSIRNLVHWAQSVKSKRFQKYDYGGCSGNTACPNTLRYGSGRPPEYDLYSYRVPTVLVSGGKDPISNKKDVKKLKNILADNGGDVLLESKTIDSYDHNDFTIAIDGDKVLFPMVVEHLVRATCGPGPPNPDLPSLFPPNWVVTAQGSRSGSMRNFLDRNLP